MLRAMAHSPAALKVYLATQSALAEGVLPARLRELVAVTAAEQNECEYCLSAHAQAATRLGASGGDVAAAQRGDADDPATRAALSFTRTLLASGTASDADFADLRRAGLGDAEIVEIIANATIHAYPNTFNRAVDTALDFAAVPLEGRKASPIHVMQARSAYPYEETIRRLKEELVHETLWLIHEIDTQAILRSAGLEVRGIRQLLFFHPRFMQDLLERDRDSILHVPLKLFVTEEAGHVRVASVDPQVLFGSDALRGFARGLRETVARLLSSVAAGKAEGR
jgi:uncharacterized peroxidase-related enzyme